MRSARLVLVGELGLLAGVLAGACRKLGDFDLGWHLATGRSFVTHASPVDDFSYTLRGTPLDIEYVGDGLLYLADHAFGTLGLHLLAALAIAALTSLLVARGQLSRSSPSSSSRGPAVACAALALIVSGSWLVVRPALLSFALLAAILFLVDGNRPALAASTTPNLRRFALVIPLQYLYSATHGFAPLGALIVLGYACYAVLCRLLKNRLGALFPAVEGRNALAIFAIALLAVVATCLGPHGTAVFTLPIRMRGYEAVLTEWTPTTIAFVARHDPALLVLGLAAIAAFALGREPDASHIPTACDLGLAFAGAMLASASVRLIPLGAIIVAPIVARRLTAALSSARTTPFLVAAVGLATAPALLLSPGARPGFGFDTRNLPDAAARYIASVAPRGPLYNFLPFGGQLIYRLHSIRAPDMRVFIDGRTGWLYPRDFTETALRAEHDARVFADLDEKYRFEWAVERAAPGERFGEPLAADPRFALVFLDETAAVYVRRNGENAALASSGYAVLRHLTSPVEVLARVLRDPLDTAYAEALVHDAALAVSQAPDSTRAHFIAAAAALAKHDRAAVAAERSRIEALDPDYLGLPALDRVLSATTAAAPR